MDAKHSPDGVIHSVRCVQSPGALAFLAVASIAMAVGLVWVAASRPLTWNAWPLALIGALPVVALAAVWRTRNLVIEASGEGLRRLTPAARSWTWGELRALVPVGDDALVLVLGPARRRQLRVDPDVRPAIVELARTAGVAVPAGDSGGVVRSEVVASRRAVARTVIACMVGGAALFAAMSVLLTTVFGKGPSPVTWAVQGVLMGLILAGPSLGRRTLVQASDLGIAIMLGGAGRRADVFFEPWGSLDALTVKTRHGRMTVRPMKKSGRAIPFAIDPATLPAFEALARAHGVRVVKDA